MRFLILGLFFFLSFNLTGEKSDFKYICLRVNFISIFLCFLVSVNGIKLLLRAELYPDLDV